LGDNHLSIGSSSNYAYSPPPVEGDAAANAAALTAAPIGAVVECYENSNWEGGEPSEFKEVWVKKSHDLWESNPLI